MKTIKFLDIFEKLFQKNISIENVTYSYSEKRKKLHRKYYQYGKNCPYYRYFVEDIYYSLNEKGKYLNKRIIERLGYKKNIFITFSIVKENDLIIAQKLLEMDKISIKINFLKKKIDSSMKKRGITNLEKCKTLPEDIKKWLFQSDELEANSYQIEKELALMDYNCHLRPNLIR